MSINASAEAKHRTKEGLKVMQPTKPQKRLIFWVADCYGVPGKWMRNRHITTPNGYSRAEVATLRKARHMAFFLLAEFGGLSLPEVGRVMGGWHHTTVWYGREKIAEHKADAKIQKFIETAKGILGDAGKAPAIPEPKPYREAA